MANNRTLGCLSIFLFVALMVSVIGNFILAATAFRRMSGVAREELPMPRFREVVMERATRGSDDKIAAYRSARSY